MSAAAYRLRRALRRYGVRGTVERGLTLARERVLLSESHVWYELDPAGERPRPQLVPEATLRRGQEADLPLLEELPTISSRVGSARLGDGNDLWLVLEGDRPLFSCWIFWDETPMVAAPRGMLRLPEGTCCLEDSVVSSAARGKGIAPAAWAAIADALADLGQRHIITKVEVENTPSRHAVEKVGFESVALMHFNRLGPRSRTRIEVLDEARGGFFAQSLSSGDRQR